MTLGREQEVGEGDAASLIFRRIEDSNRIHNGSAFGYRVGFGIRPGNSGILRCHRRVAQVDLVRQRNVRDVWSLDLVDVEEPGIKLPRSHARHQFLFGEDLAGVLIASQDFLRQARLVIVRLRQFKCVNRVDAFGIEQRVGAAQAQTRLL